MGEEHTDLYYFFFADFCRITINIIVFFGLILFIFVLYKAFSNKDSKFTFIFIIMINVMICSILSILGYIFNWKVVKNEGRELLFKDDLYFLCQFQSILLTYFQTVRESLLTSLTIIVIFDYLGKNIKKIFKILLFIFCYGIPFISNIICFCLDGFGETDLFCFTDSNNFGRSFGILHFGYIFLLILSNIILCIIILIMDYKQGKSNKVWLNLDNSQNKESGCNISPEVRKIAFYPVAQIICLFFPITYRIGNNSKAVEENILLAQITAIGNSLSSILYALIFIITNKKIFWKKKEMNNLIINESNEKQLIEM